MMHSAMLVALPSLLLIISLLLCWTARPIKNTTWTGEQAADMAAGLIIALSAAGHLWQQLSGNESAQLMLDSLAWYAALPLLVTVRMVRAAQHLGFAWHWDRMIWGRILLALCVVFELSRRANQLDIIVEVTAVIGAIALSIIALRPTLNMILALSTLAWIAGVAGYFIYRPEQTVSLIVPVIILLVIKVSRTLISTASMK